MAVIPRPSFGNYKLGAPPKSTRQKVLAQWRGLDLSPLETARTDRTRKTSDVLPKVLAGMRLERRQSEAEIIKVWNSSLDPAIVAHAQPTSYNKGTLFVSVDNSVWLSEIVRYRRKEIMDRLKHSFGADFITKISFRVG